ncbi:DUF6460 domain-containing protein [Maritalea sp.]|uniref:DUF6460 domain-containing protein n=1 Tax=Maritalea sp. TaxID=2003361 RepID=UPI003EF11123
MSKTEQRDYDDAQEPERRNFFGGSPKRVFFKLVILSLVVGFVMRVMDITPGTIFGTLGRYVGATFADLGSFMGDLGIWFGFGAAIVFPLYILIRLWRRLVA